jgi:tRNA threonylcarbamoyladenosine biosynthesis protein TsaE
MQIVQVKSLKELRLAAISIVDTIPTSGIVLFVGEMGAGKTTLISTICACLGVKQPVSSPTYSLVNTYQSADGSVIHHLDLYRIQSEAELLEAGIEELFHENAVILIEWPQIAYPFLPEDYLIVEIELLTTGARQINLKTPQEYPINAHQQLKTNN